MQPQPELDPLHLGFNKAAQRFVNLVTSANIDRTFPPFLETFVSPSHPQRLSRLHILAAHLCQQYISVTTHSLRSCARVVVVTDSAFKDFSSVLETMSRSIPELENAICTIFVSLMDLGDYASQNRMAIMMSHHPRLGAASPLRHLPVEILRKIAEFNWPELFMDPSHKTLEITGFKRLRDFCELDLRVRLEAIGRALRALIRHHGVLRHGICRFVFPAMISKPDPSPQFMFCTANILEGISRYYDSGVPDPSGEIVESVREARQYLETNYEKINNGRVGGDEFVEPSTAAVTELSSRQRYGISDGIECSRRLANLRVTTESL